MKDLIGESFAYLAGSDSRLMCQNTDDSRNKDKNLCEVDGNFMQFAMHFCLSAVTVQ